VSVAIDARGTVLVTTLTRSVSTLYNGITVGSVPNSALVLFLTLDSLSDTVDCVWDSGGTNQVMSLVNSNGTTYIYGLLNPTPGNNSLSVTPQINTQKAYIDAVSCSGVDQTDIPTDFANPITDFATSASPSLTVTSSPGDLVLVALQATNAAISSFGQDQIYRDFTLGAGHQSSGATDAPGAASVTLTATLASSVAWAICGIDVVAAAASNPSNNSMLSMGI
jgi:hypothetical protein